MSSETVEPAIRIEGVGKEYQLGAGTGHDARLSEQLQHILQRAFRRRSHATSHLTPDARTHESLWALRDVSLEVHAGEALGLIGPNGAGKSTLLKLLSRITLPTEGRITLRGRVATLLEVGTGFHPDLTGRENIFINGAILGMRRREIEARFDEIVEFSGIERFIDTPVKRYSSGMYVRLAFAVAAHLQPEILLVDEVLAVGDAEFQRRCLGKMQEVSAGGRTVVFVSHNMAAVQRLCSRAVLIDKGRLVLDGMPGEVVAAYLDRGWSVDETGVTVIGDDADRFKGSCAARLRKVLLTDTGGRPTSSVRLGQRFRITLTFDILRPIGEAVVEIGISTTEGQRFATVQTSDRADLPLLVDQGTLEISAEIGVTLLPGEYVFEVALHDSNGVTADFVYRALRFTALNVPDSDQESYPWSVVRGFVRPDAVWSQTRAARVDAVSGPVWPTS
jgi:lipopolysaccharide transport system ATP-binding protein